tara:strand:+ start:173 stop:835 length:663 start_codon:yes stop_codon:yes gene_type:complete
MTAYLIDVTFGYISWVILILLVYGIIKLFKKEKFKTINFKVVFLVSIIGVFSPTLGLMSGKYQTAPEIEMSEQDKAGLKTIIQSCLSGEEISKDTHVQFYSIVDEYKISEEDLNEMFLIFYNEDLMLLQKSFYNDALKTIQTGQISKSESREDLENKLLNDSQKERNREYLLKIQSKEPIDIGGEEIVLDEEICLTIIDNIEDIFQIGQKNIATLKNRNF